MLLIINYNVDDEGGHSILILDIEAIAMNKTKSQLHVIIFTESEQKAMIHTHSYVHVQMHKAEQELERGGASLDGAVGMLSRR